MILLDYFIIMILVNLIGCCSWSPAMLCVVYSFLPEVCVAVMCNPMSNITDVYTIVSVNFHFPMNVNW
jgi:hypothetical protein